VDYGGVFDLFYKLPALKKEGVKIHLHCFEYGRSEQPMLNTHCETVRYYERRRGAKGFSFRLPHIVQSRKNDELLSTLLKDDHPILMEGIHCTWLLNDARFERRVCFIRLHNVENIYYRNLFKLTTSWLKKFYYLQESRLLLNYEKKIASKAACITVAERDGEVYRTLGCQKLYHLPVFLPGWQIKNKEGIGTFCLYHGDLSVAENEQAALWLIKQIFSQVDIPLVVSGKNPSSKLHAIAGGKNNICLVANPQEGDLQDMIEKAQINILPTSTNTGIKLKLINALFNGRHCIVNKSTVEGTNLAPACHIASDPAAWISKVSELMQKPFTADDTVIRHQLITEVFNNETNAKRLIQLVWQSP
jgi:hypothetical protein